MVQKLGLADVSQNLLPLPPAFQLLCLPNVLLKFASRFNLNLACGALSVVISTIPYSFNGQHAIGKLIIKILKLIA